MTDLIVVEKIAEWQRLKALVLDSVSSPITKRVYNMALDEFIAWYRQQPRPGFSRHIVSARDLREPGQKMQRFFEGKVTNTVTFENPESDHGEGKRVRKPLN